MKTQLSAQQIARFKAEIDDLRKVTRVLRASPEVLPHDKAIIRYY